MEPEIIQQPTEQPSEQSDGKTPRKKIALYISAPVFILFVIYYAVMTLLAPASKISEINSKFGYKEAENTKTDKRIFSDSSFIALNREKAFHQARITMAESDSVCLSLNLSDSTAILEIKGVAVHKSKMSRISISKVLNRSDEYAITSMLAVPFTVSRYVSSIKKEPVMVKTAPKDTSEYKPDIVPDTTKKERVSYMLEMDYGFRLYIYQDGSETSKGALGRFFFDLGDRIRNSRDIIKGMVTFKVPEYHPAIRIRLPQSDCKIIFRALPQHSQIAVYR